MKVFLASFEHLEQVSQLFDRYRVFYQQSSDLEAARNFLEERFQKSDSTLLVASYRGKIVGFTQLYPSFSSVSMKPVWILNDLFVEELYRNQGVAKLLMNAAENLARETGVIRITLATQGSNIAAQSLYKSLGYSQQEEFYHYALQV
ncbi:GNAT family N-acetyltransferase [Merismopedia glauca]|uniref:GNAT family N-acetyltransferase n=1 Tax=Merismopedia glauca CCAP 1448/3 TaxID=1296344 RepID=A0A2T1BWT1_9CYAN|nr:GNAT family N-acetyltransferase [Merismopedia glauca]PSB00461.1 GNAT family N-acetyltransferase [Merismopedia glauca CCAP 1448/3]